MQSNQIYISTLKTAIQKALTKNLPLILNDVVEYLEKHNFEVKQRKRRTKTKSLQKKTQACLNLNTKPLQISEFSDDGKEKIKKKFYNKVKGIEICLDGKNTKHCGKEGHWLEEKMGIEHNAKNKPDIHGYEMKKHSKGKITLGDYSASEYAFSKKNKRKIINEINNWTNEKEVLSRNDYIKMFGNPNPKKNNRHSWSGRCVPTYNTWNPNGQILLVNDNNDIVAYYSFSKDTREIKDEFPEFLRRDDIVIALWKSEKMKPHIDSKFNQKGFFICKKIGSTYEKICFGKPFNFVHFIEGIKTKKIIFDSGMYYGNMRNYSQFRGGPTFWDELIIEEY